MRSRTWVIGFVLLLVACGVAASLLLVYDRVGRTPAEIITYAKRRLIGHPKLETVALPVLERLRDHFGDPELNSRGVPFEVPRLQPNPAAAGSAAVGPAHEAGRVNTRGSASGLERVLRVGALQAVKTLAAAARLVRDGDTVEIDPGDYIADVAIWDRAALTLRGMGNRVRLIAAGASAEGKAIWVIRRGEVTVENIEFIGARVEDRNGAGIRLEGGHLTVRRCVFFDNQNGILTGNEAGTRLDIESSEFAYNGAGDGLSHNLYVGQIDALRVSGSYFHHANAGHLVKSRARENWVAYNRITDEPGGRASYELEFPNGGLAQVVGNLIQQGAETRNSVIVSFGAEGYAWPLNRLQLAHNTIVNDQSQGGTFVRVTPGAEGLQTRNNLFVGRGRVDAGESVDAAGDHRVDWSAFARAARQDFRLDATRPERLAELAAVAVEPALSPKFEYRHPVSLQRLEATPRLAGALQSTSP